MSKNVEDLIASEIDDISKLKDEIDLFVLAAGFEERALSYIANANFSENAHCLIIRYSNGVNDKDQVFEKYQEIASRKFNSDRLKIVDLNPDRIEEFSSALENRFENFPPEIKKVAIDVSGMTSYAICLCLKLSRKIRPFEKQTVLYTSAEDYVPSEQEYEDLVGRTESDGMNSNEIDYLPKSMALEMSENLVIEAFKGHSSGNTRTCLAVFAGYEVHRTSGTIDAINPSLLLLLYGVPGDDRHNWRLDLSKRLHSRFEKGRRCASEELSTLRIQESIDMLEKYYDQLIDDYDMVIAPICSKMHSVAAYLFWERYGEVQLSFPLPIGYNPENRPTGIGKTYQLDIYEQRMLFRDSPS